MVNGDLEDTPVQCTTPAPAKYTHILERRIASLINVQNLLKSELAEYFVENGHRSYRAEQLWDWMYRKGCTDFSLMSSFSKDFCEWIDSRCGIFRPKISDEKISIDGTIKWLLMFADAKKTETVYIPAESRGTVCVSSQIGCTLNCDFCYTGTQKWARNIQTSEIVGQLLLVKDYLNDWNNEESKITNIVLMGMGEPLLNYDNVFKAVKIFLDKDGLNFSRKKVTLSTSGVVPFIKKCGEELGVNLAVSLHAVTDDARNVLVPINRKYPIAELMKACREYPMNDRNGRITFEYVMLAGVNDFDEDAKELAKMIRGFKAMVNLIPFNPWPGTKYTCSSPEKIGRFASILYKYGCLYTIRATRGQDILAACGQLKSKSERKKFFLDDD